MRTRKGRIYLILGLMGLLGMYIWWHTSSYYVNLEVAGILFFFALHVLSDYFAVELPKGGGVSFGFAVDIASIVIFGPFLATIIGTGGIIGAFFSLSLGVDKAIMNILLYMLTISSTGAIYANLGGSFTDLVLIRDALPLLGAACGYLLVNASFLTAVISTLHDLDFKSTWQSNVKWALPSFIALAPLGYLLAAIYEFMGIPGAVLLLIPLFLARFSFNQYVETKKAHLSIVQALAAALEAKDPYTKGHSDRVAEYVETTCRQMETSEEFVEEVVQAARMHDIGKIGVPEEILNKPGRLTSDEFDHIKNHPQIGSNILQNIEFLNSIANIIRYHHEWYDGSRGYPNELSFESIPLGARILMVADSFDAMTSDRPYRRALSKEEAMDELLKASGSQFDPEIVEAFVKSQCKEGEKIKNGDLGNRSSNRLPKRRTDSQPSQDSRP